MLNVNAAAKELIKSFPENAISTASEIDDYFIFSTRPKNSPFGVATGIVGYFIDKKTGVITPRSVLDDIVFESKIHISYDPITLKEEE